MRALLLFPYYVRWHYGQALKGIYEITGNLVWFIWHFFSIGLMLRTFFAPWQRLHEERVRGFDLEGYFSAMIINIVMRCVGILIRAVFIAVGITAIAAVIAGGAFVFAAWLILPLAVLFSFIFGFILLFKAS